MSILTRLKRVERSRGDGAGTLGPFFHRFDAPLGLIAVTVNGIIHASAGESDHAFRARVQREMPPGKTIDDMSDDELSAAIDAPTKLKVFASNFEQ